MKIIENKETGLAIHLDYIPKTNELLKIIEEFKLSNPSENGFEMNPEVRSLINSYTLNTKRDKELKTLIINNISCTESNLFKMAVKHSVLPESGTVNWIDIDNNTVEMSKDELGQLIGMGAGAVEEIYLRYRQLKDEIK